MTLNYVIIRDPGDNESYPQIVTLVSDRAYVDFRDDSERKGYKFIEAHTFGDPEKEMAVQVVYYKRTCMRGVPLRGGKIEFKGHDGCQ